MQYGASIDYNEKTVAKLDNAVNSTFFFSKRVSALVTCVLMIGGGVFLGFDNTVGVICTLLGCFMLPSVGSIRSRNARQIIKVLNGRPLTMHYVFRNDGFSSTVGEETQENRYHTVIRLVEEKGYLYLFQKVTQACMVDTSTIEPAELENFKKFISKHVGLAWTPMNTFRNFSFQQRRFNKENTRKMAPEK